MEFELPGVAALRRPRWDVGAALTCITTPTPTGRGYATAALKPSSELGTVVLLDGPRDFAEENAMELAPNIPCWSYLRIGYAVGHPSLIAGLSC
jgi:hypothetical protein